MWVLRAWPMILALWLPGDGNSAAAWRYCSFHCRATAARRNISKHLPFGFRVDPHSHLHRRSSNFTQLRAMLAASWARIPRIPGIRLPIPGHRPHRFTSTTLADFLNELSSPLSYEINDFSANFQQFAFWPRPGTKMGMAKGACKQQIESENFLWLSPPCPALPVGAQVRMKMSEVGCGDKVYQSSSPNTQWAVW